MIFKEFIKAKNVDMKTSLFNWLSLEISRILGISYRLFWQGKQGDPPPGAWSGPRRRLTVGSPDPPSNWKAPESGAPIATGSDP